MTRGGKGAILIITPLADSIHWCGRYTRRGSEIRLEDAVPQAHLVALRVVAVFVAGMHFRYAGVKAVHSAGDHVQVLLKGTLYLSNGFNMYTVTGLTLSPD